MMNGLEVISAIRTDPKLSSIQAVMLSTSSDPSLAERAIKAGIYNFFIKPDTFEGFLDLAKQLST